MKTIIYLVYDLEAELSIQNINTINAVTELNFQTDKEAADYIPVTYKVLIEARKASLGGSFGVDVKLNGVPIHVLPCPPMGLVVDPTSEAIKQISRNNYEKNYLPLFDIEN